MSTATRTDLELAEAHKYRLPNGEVAVNVTTISGLLDMGKSAAFAVAAARLTREGLDYRQEWTAKASTGTRVHSVCEDWLLERESEVEDSDQGCVDALEKFWLDCQPVKIECEAIVLSDRGYGGRMDMIAQLADYRVVLIDVKTGRPYPTEHTLQLSAYRYGDGIATYDAGGMLASLRPIPTVDACACLYVHGDGTYDLTEYPADKTAHEHFCALLEVYRWAKRIVKEAR